MRAAAGRREDGQAGVSSVVGTVLMLGITISVFAGFSLFVLQEFSDQAEANLRADLGVLQDGGRYLLQHRGGEPLTLAQGRLIATVDGSAVNLPLTVLAAQTADGQHWRIGDTLCVSGPAPPCLYDHKDVTGLLVTYANAVVLSDAGFGAAEDVVYTYVATNTPTSGTVTGFAAAQSTVDGLDADLAEGGTTTPAGSGASTLSGTGTTATSVSTPNNALAGALSGDSTNLRAYMDSSGDLLTVTGFTAPPTAATITSVTIGFEGRAEQAGGQSPTVLLSYKVSGVTGASTLSQTLTSTTEAQYTRVVTADRSWTPANLNALSVVLQVTNSPNRDAGIDHVYVTVQYNTAPTTTYATSIAMQVTGVPAGTSEVLQLRYHATGDSFRVQVWDGATYTTRGVTLNAPTATTWSYTLSATELSAGTVRIRFVDLATTGTTQGHLYLDYVRVVTT